MIHDRILLRKNIYANSVVVCMDLWEMGGHYNIANDTLIDLRNKRLEECIAAHNDVILFR